jgi:phosphohistidine swiveling domain-containing protein
MIDKYGFTTTGIFGGDLITKDNYLEEIRKILESEYFVKELEEIRATEITIKKRMEIDSMKTDLHRVADTVGRLLVYRYNTNAYAISLVEYFERIGTALEKKYGLEEGSTDYYSLDEVVSLTEEGVVLDQGKVEKRKKGFLIRFNLDKVEIFEGDEAREEIKDLLEFRRKSHSEFKTLSGTVASWPDKSVEKVRGRVFALTTNFGSAEKIKEFKEGDILVATQTHPTLVPAMRKAGAIVTDEGGLTCHAAIVSRELKKPCIIGTKLASKTLKTGDVVELDLLNGTVDKKN